MIGGLIAGQLGLTPVVAAEKIFFDDSYRNCENFCNVQAGNVQKELPRYSISSDSWIIAQTNPVYIAVQQYLITTNGGPVGNRNYWNNNNIPLALAYIDFFNFFVLKFGSEVIPVTPTVYRTVLPDGTIVIVRPNATTINVPTVEIQRPTGIPYKVRYLTPGETL